MNQLKKNGFIILLTILLSFVWLSSCTTYKLTDSDKQIISETKKMLSGIKAYNYGQSRESLTTFSDFVRSAVNSPDSKIHIEKEMISFLKSDASFAGKQFVCEQLSIIGTKESVPQLVKMLSDEKTADIALFTLQRIEDPSVDKKLLKALSGYSDKVKIGIINCLGERGNADAVSKLEKLVSDKNTQIAIAAAAALGKIDDNSAAESLERAKSNTSGKVHERILDAYLKCADNLLRQGNTAQASSIYQNIYRSEESNHIRAAALRGFLKSNKSTAVDIILSALKNEDQELQTAAVGFIRELPDNTDLKKVIEECPNLSDQSQIQLLSVFADRNETSARQAVISAAGHRNENVRLAALKAVADVGNESDISLLARAAAGERGKVRDAARESLYLLRGESVNQKIILQIRDAYPEIKSELILAAGQRNIINAVKTLISACGDHDLGIRRNSLKSLAIIASPEYTNDIISLLVKEENAGIRSEAEKTLVAVTKKIPDGQNKAKSVIDILPSVGKIEAKSSLIQVLGRIGDKRALPVLREYLKSTNAAYQEAAIHALSGWFDAEPVNDLMDVVKTTNNEIHKILALRGYINLLSIQNNRKDTESIVLYLAAMDHAAGLTEKRMVISGLSNLRSMEALEVTAKYLDSVDIQPEAEVAVMRLTGRIRDADNERLKEVLNKVLKNTKNSQLKERAKNRLKSLEDQSK
ncbi:HEAT repeat domain-containing protein [candidate division KSB1 bacterium]